MVPLPELSWSSVYPSCHCTSYPEWYPGLPAGHSSPISGWSTLRASYGWLPLRSLYH
jgi:hypothetical protein